MKSTQKLLCGTILFFAFLSVCFNQSTDKRNSSEPRFVPVSQTNSSTKQGGIQETTAGGYWDSRFFTNGTDRTVTALVLSGANLYAGGYFMTAGGVTVNGLGKWNGTAWSSIGLPQQYSPRLLAMLGNDLYAAGWFYSGGTFFMHLVKWDGSAWSNCLMTPWGYMTGAIFAMAGSGTDLFIGGRFTNINGVQVNNIAKWNGMAWSSLVDGVVYSGTVYALAVNGTDLYAGGNFTTAGGVAANSIAKWDGTAWQALDSGTNGTVNALAVDEQGLYVGGTFSKVGENASGNIARWIFTTLPAINLNRTSLNFGATNGVATSAQSIIVGNSGGGTLNWSAASNQSWLGVTPASGMGTGLIHVYVNPTGLAANLTAGAYQGTITVSDPNAANSPQTINVGLTVKAAGTSTLPFGDFATPINGTTGITGAIPVTGWVLDDIEVTRVDVKRDPHATDPTGAIGPDGLVFVGYGLFVEGARPDVETGYAGYPLNYRAGWGYMLLTNFLPLQGNGTFKLYAIASDKEGNTVTLGTKTITCSNATAIKPFGTIDTPTQGGDASGNLFLNFGWVLTPMPKTVAKNGSTIDVYVDSVKVGNLATAPNVYNQYRVDVATAFPGLNNSAGPVGAYYLDTTTYANGVHTIFWIATDDAGQADGIGSRYFNVVNTGTSAEKTDNTYTLRVPELSNTRTNVSGSHREERSDAAQTRDMYSLRVPDLTDILNLPVSFATLNIKRGFNLAASPEIIIPDNFGSIHIEMKEAELLEFDLGKGTGYRGYVVVGDELRPLPIGSTLDPSTGRFSWLPGPGFLGTYEIMFLKTDAFCLTKRIPITVTIKPKFKGSSSPGK